MTDGATNWVDLRYLCDGTARQRAAYVALSATEVMTVLADYGPVLAGTIPLAVDLPDSDLDILCQVHNHAQFAAHLEAHWGDQPGLAVRHGRKNGLATTIATFHSHGFEFEIFGQSQPVEDQNGFRHMVVEARLLQMGGETARRAIRRLKANGLKTEPAFARYFKLTGDPYIALLDLYTADDAVLSRLVEESLSHR